MKVGFIPIRNAITDFTEDYGFNDIPEDLIIKWGTDILGQINTDEQLTHKITILDIDNYKTSLPTDFKLACEVAYRIDPPKCSPKQRIDQVTQWVQKTDEGCELEINVNCPDCHKTKCKENGQNYVEVDVDKIWELQNAWRNYSGKFSRVSHFGKGSSVYTPEFRLLKHEQGTDWSGIQRHIPDCANIHCEDCEESYSINHPNIEVSFKKGEVLLSYLAKVTDSNGDLMIPDTPLVLEAIGDYLLFRLMKKEYFKSKEAKDYRAYKDAEQAHYMSLGRARSNLQIPSYQEWVVEMRSNKYYKLDDAYSNFMHHGVGRPTRSTTGRRLRH